jgi:biopolymer transport protein TolR
MEVSVRADQSLWLRDRAKGGSELRVTRNELIARIKEKQQRNADQAVVISADKDVRYEAVLEVMDMLQQNQVRKVGLLAKPRTP